MAAILEKVYNAWERAMQIEAQGHATDLFIGKSVP